MSEGWRKGGREGREGGREGGEGVREEGREGGRQTNIIIHTSDWTDSSSSESTRKEKRERQNTCHMYSIGTQTPLQCYT